MSHFNNVNVGVTGFVFDSRYTFTGLGYLAVCWQKQWGNLWAGYTEVLNWYFPLTTSQVYAVCLTKHTKNISSGHNWEPARIEEWNNSYARIHPDGDLGYSVIAICKAQQQWGIVYAEQGYIIVTLPLAYSSNKYVVIGQDLDYTSNDTDGYGENVGITQVTTTSIRVSITRGRYLSYCTIGF